MQDERSGKDITEAKILYWLGIGHFKHTKWMYMSFTWRLLRYCALFAHGSCIFAESARLGGYFLAKQIENTWNLHQSPANCTFRIFRSIITR